ncbi:filamentous hemagglutinin N-terminal domain-containing protein [Trichormus variabilis PNB]|uniref:Filamentous hemagglutinin N-terminal domain-containing protein n=2 Tax=Anabaena variabilis TaxID=264691 RepID=A0ABR6SA64_ANAVA|nr:filamentous hemagglutinin N-terminal domain-containing protein [Trichormus variabilis]MBC1257004.1 filamentous hemagglutinin N-terminal domain-containing protein [Trichormus variabilis V5]MBC1303302.1 filamentous hemagglutinin N-terminal domain-containing protein [Trichormus variabilis N2B]MBC1311970.1 filamentous hemagglutinin N-terminal domain-containing protein [Trichormus variabilis PNB]
MIKRNYLNRCLSLSLLVSVTLTTNGKILAQVTADQTLETQVIDIGLNSFILGGTTVGNTNLFHSFASFNVPSNGAAIFINDPSLTNIFARVTGGTASDVQGRIGTQGTANLYLINPNGIIFGTNASLNIGGSFVATTANAIQFPGGAEFSLNSSVSPDNHLLRVNPTAFLFNQIANQGTNSIENRAYLGVPNNRSLILLGGNIAPTSHTTGRIIIDGGVVQALGGRVEIGGLVEPGSIGINIDGNKFSLNFPDSVAKTDISLINNSALFISGAGGGDIIVNADNLSLNSSYFFAGILNNQGNPETKAGDISINATGIVTVAQNSIIGNSSVGIGDSGNINIFGQSLQIIGNSAVQSSALQGNSGTINIKVDDTIALLGSQIGSIVRPRDTSVSSLQSRLLGTPTRGKSGGINIQARNLLAVDSSSISASNFLADDSGDIKIQAADTVILNNRGSISSTAFGQGKSGNLSISTNRLNVINYSQIAANTLGTGNAGDININAEDINIEDKSFITSSTSSFFNTISNVGNAGNINIQTSRISVKNSGFIISISGDREQALTNGLGGNINITATELIEIDAKGATDIITGFSAKTFSDSRAGDITLNTKNLIVRNGGAITAEAANSLGGNAGNININASDTVKLISSPGNSYSRIFTGVVSSDNNVTNAGNGGELKITTGKLQLTNGIISAATFGQGHAGNITIFSNDEIVLDSGLIFSLVGAGAVGNGGDINIQTPRLTLTNGSQVDASIRGGGIGKGGTIRIDAADYVIISGRDADGFESFLAAETSRGGIGQPGDIIVNTDYFLLEKNGFVTTGTFNSSNGGSITINTRIFEALTGGQIFSSTGSSGKAGDIIINATDSIIVSGVNAETGNNAAIVAGTLADSTGNGGTVSLSTNNFHLSNEAGVLTRSQGRGIAGDINITARGNFYVNHAFVSAQAEQAGGGNIDITAKNINLRNNSDIRTDLSNGSGRGGGISLTANTIIALEDSDILAFAPEGQGGDIKFNTRAVFSDSLYTDRQTIPDRNSLQSLVSNGSSDINATGTISGNIIGVPDISSIQNGLTDLQANPIDTTVLIANSCIARSLRQEGSFVITGTGGLPTRPGEVMASSYATGDVQSVSDESKASLWKKGDPIIEPQGVYRLANGVVVMSRECH